MELRHSWIWVVFLAFTFTGAAMLFSPSKADDVWGIVLMLLPLAFFAAILWLYYWKSRRELT